MDEPYIAAQQSLPEITVKVVVLAIILAAILAMSNAYLALKIGILTSASIPAAIVSMGVLRFFRGSNILENNLVQTAASAGEAVAGGIVYTIPALVLIHYWAGFDYWQNFFIALISGVLGVLFSIPIRRILVNEPQLKFPEGRAIAEVLIVGHDKQLGLKTMIMGSIVGAAIELLQTGFKVVASNLQLWFTAGKSLVGFGAGFSATLIGAGYLVGFRVGASIFIGAVIAWFISVPVLSEAFHITHVHANATAQVINLWGQKIRYIGIGAMVVAGLWSLGTLCKPFMKHIQDAFHASVDKQFTTELLRTERDLPIHYVLIGIVIMTMALYLLFSYAFPLSYLHLGVQYDWLILCLSLLYMLIIGFLFSAICGYFSGLVGVTASPGSAIIIAGLIIAALMLRLLLSWQNMDMVVNAKQAAAVITIFLGALITGSAAIANDNIQDLKVGHIVGSTPWKQQVMLMLGVLVAAAVIPLVMQLLFDVYGIGDVLPRAGMDPSQALPAPPAALMAAVTQGVFNYMLPWDMIGIGVVIAIIFIILNVFLQRRHWDVSVLAVAIGIYLPISSSVPIFIGGLIALISQRGLKKLNLPAEQQRARLQKGMLLACGLVTGAALMDVILAVPFAIMHNPDALKIVPDDLLPFTEILGFVVTVCIGYWIYKLVCKSAS